MMRRIMPGFAALAAAFAFAFAASAARGDAFDDAISENHDRFAGLFHSYEFSETADTPPPAGYVPFYVSHYGRHGSRRQMAGWGAPAYNALAAADKKGLLTDVGKRLFADVSRIHAEHVGMEGELTERGALEHRQIAKRMNARFPGVFTAGRTARCRATLVPRCMISMANFTLSLKDAAPGIDFTYATGEKIRRILLRPYDTTDAEKKAIEAFSKDHLAKTIDAEPLFRRVFADAPESREIVGDPREFARHLFFYACSCQCLALELGGLDITGYFTPSELDALARLNDARRYAGMGNSAEFGRRVARTGETLAADIVERADAALADASIAADLRFGHDSGLWPLAGTLGLVGPGAVAPAADAPLACPVWKNMPMGSNLQIAFYRNGDGDVIVKLLFNEREAVVEGLTPVAGPYYRWPDLRQRLVGRVANNAP